MKEPNNIIREEFLLLAEKLKLDTRFWSQEAGDAGLESVVRGLESELNAFLTQDPGQIYVGPYMLDWSPLTPPKADSPILWASLSPTGRGKDGGGRLSERELESLVGVYKKLFLPHRQIKFIGVDLDDCLYDVTPIRHLLVQKINNELSVESSELRVRTRDSGLPWALYNVYKDNLEPEDVKKQKALMLVQPYRLNQLIIERTYNVYKDFSRLDALDTRALYKPYEGVANTLRHLMDSGDFIVGILTNGPSRLQRDKINLLGLKEGKHFNFVMTSEDIGIGKPSKRFFELARERASRMWSAECGVRNKSTIRNPQSTIRNDECLILEDQVKLLSGADGWLKVQFLKGYHLNIQPENTHEIPKYGITRFSILPDLLNLERNSSFQDMAASCFILKVLLSLHR